MRVVSSTGTPTSAATPSSESSTDPAKTSISAIPDPSVRVTSTDAPPASVPPLGDAPIHAPVALELQLTAAAALFVTVTVALPVVA